MADEQVIERIIKKALDAYCLSKAISEDYAKIIGKIENVPEKEVLSRINRRAQEIFNSIRDEENKRYEEAKKKI